MGPDAVERMPFLRKEGLLHAAIMNQKMQEVDQDLEDVRADLKSWVKGVHQHGNARR
ncbi:hypothetical protein LCGC14_2711600 [marine sediment metagenome]|uniref:Uncharacterized protein n=1 Tax=marine sediment metagenome TaxID=412755 RepID=A0A0F8ZCQ4_9ZZZZ